MAADYSENKRVLRKIITITAISCVAIAGLIGLALLFNIFSYADFIGNILLTVLIVFLAGMCLLNAIDAIAKMNKTGIITAGFVLLSSVLFLVMVWAGKFFGGFYDAYAKITVIIAMASILLDVIVGNYIVMGKKNLVLQIIDYIALVYIEIAIALAILGFDTLIKIWTLFGAVVIVFIVLYIILRVLAKAKRSNEQAVEKKELEDLKAENERLKKLLDDNGIEY